MVGRNAIGRISWAACCVVAAAVAAGSAGAGCVGAIDGDPSEPPPPVPGGDAGAAPPADGGSDDPDGATPSPTRDAGPPGDAGFASTGDSLLLYSSMDGQDAIFHPEHAVATYGSLDEAVPAPSMVSYEPGAFGQAARFDGTSEDARVEGLARLPGDNFDISDPDSDGGRLDFWLKFNQDPHESHENLWFARANFSALGTGWRLFDIEYVSSQLHIYVYSMTVNNERTNYGNFKVTPRTMPLFRDRIIQAGEWHLFTLLWRRNGGPHKAELHLFVDGTQEGCLECSDYNGNLPEVGEVTDLFLSPALPQNDGSGYRHMLFSIDEIYSFSSWDTSGVEGTFADLEIPEGVTPTYPMDKDYPQWGSPVPVQTITFEFFAVRDAPGDFDCDLYVDETFAGSATTRSRVHTEIPHDAVLAEGLHTWQVRCDGDRLVSDVQDFLIEL